MSKGIARHQVGWLSGASEAMRSVSARVRGQVVDWGTHAELVALGGRYAASWRAQMREAGGDSGVGSEQALAEINVHGAA